MKRQKPTPKKRNPNSANVNQVRLSGEIKFPKGFVPWRVARGTTEFELREMLCDARDECLDRDAIILLELLDNYSVTDLYVNGLIVLKD
ncbi:hypothetical protein UFOVP1217_143 [uncultured Caudovirales phage]|jgi:hypothetical protein|uniref:Uncharacterized protein n=1 Tax=uncultured Caudovirales phage TaxID=2100421 RepID=A0A6J7X8Q2_9CAUD|nr:hypothetical protein UFOVP465_33 [uncultured Caudovirales phage]CAB4156579.1 hypothetical protein UFOVP666_79 [uncultured Caudovirales phage]CAB4160394.1 hypothetical protein UFOVP727_156 [uncultured Caudovirales phage]CAB4164783.1 hypothetical protein UFOVP819_107 [uncultured Caudovirales phage]CAB4191789.1 hypothetical protein UFOVP1217_143 [uncultured Caudovirales phage]